MSYYFNSKIRNFLGVPIQPYLSKEQRERYAKAYTGVRVLRGCHSFKWNFQKEKRNKWGDWHFAGSMFLALILAEVFRPYSSTWCILIGPAVSWFCGFLWELSDAFKPWWTTSTKETPEWKQHLFYSNGFSFADFLKWDLRGVLLALAVMVLFYLISSM